MAQSVVEQARRLDYQTLIFTTTDAQGNVFELQVAEELLRRHVDGVVAVPEGVPGHPEATTPWMALIKRDCRVVFMDRALPDLSEHTDSVVIDNKESARKATAYLVANGHERIGILAGPQALLTHSRRVDGFRQACTDGGLRLEEDWIQWCSFERESRENAARALLSYSPAVTAILATANQLGAAVLTVVGERKSTMKPPPEDVSLVMFDDVDWASFMTPPLTTVRHSPRKLGVAAVDLLLRRLRGQGAKAPQHITLPIAELVVRESVRDLSSHHAG